MGARQLLISGTDTGVGKTIVTSALAAYLQRYRPQEKVAILKPIQSGTGDREQYQRLFQLNQTLEQINPLHFEAPLAPPIAADLEGRSIDLGLVWRTFCDLQQTADWLLVEGVGGLGTPITHEWTVADLAAAWQLPIVLVVPVKLGAMGQTIAQVALARQHRLKVLGLILSCPQDCPPEEIDRLTPKSLLESFTQIPVLGVLPHLGQNTETLDRLAECASNWEINELFKHMKGQTQPALSSIK
jgi:dethiobiotin synthetase